LEKPGQHVSLEEVKSSGWIVHAIYMPFALHRIE